MNEKNSIKELISNRRATFDYEILETYEVGLVLVGTEIKSLRDGGGSLAESYIACVDNELWLIACSIPPYKHGSIYNHEEKRKRKLLAHKKEIEKIARAINEKGLTAIPLSLYLKKGVAKIRLGLCKGKKMHDKRQAIQVREEKRSIARAIRSHTH